MTSRCPPPCGKVRHASELDAIQRSIRDEAGGYEKIDHKNAYRSRRCESAGGGEIWHLTSVPPFVYKPRQRHPRTAPRRRRT